MAEDDLDARLARVAALGDPVRRALYRYVVAQPAPVSREQAAAAIAAPRHVAKFHLDRLADEGLLDIEFRRPPGRRGPGAGRPAKLYRRASEEVAITLPERRYELAGRLFAEAIDTAEREGVPVRDAVRRAAGRAGEALGEQARQLMPRRPSGADRRAATLEVLEACGFEPRPDEGKGDSIVLVNCPFHALAAEHTALVCGMNLALLDGLVTSAGPSGLAARLDPRPGRCCVRLDLTTS